ncbi:MAG: hypothetical protein A2Z27_04590 [candidate division Zixibacteria bacterium RBG_16_50_21]|nr:MAG: hypothetical protein A2Z27_04590 [candidate division Zixibacteria bacterium RBG_16_50_21]
MQNNNNQPKNPSLKTAPLLRCSLVGLSLVLFSILGCAKSNPLGPDLQLSEQTQQKVTISDPGVTASKPKPESSDRDMEMTKVYYEGPLVSKLIGLVGGTLKIPVGQETSKLYVPLGALDLSILISARAVCGTNRRGENLTEYEFWPDGLIFNRYSYLEHRTKSEDGAPVELWWYNPDKANWELVQKGIVSSGKFNFSIQHFSKYQVWEGSVSASGQ